MTTMPGIVADACCVFSTDLGWMAANWKGDKLTAFTFDHPSVMAAAGRIGVEPEGDLPVHARQFQKRMRAYAQGRRDDFLDIELDDCQSTPFQQRVIAECRRIPWGKTLSYSELALRAGSPNAARAVGNVMAHNRIPLIVPCHRVVGASGALGGFSSPNGLDTKRRLLALESHPA